MNKLSNISYIFSGCTFREAIEPQKKGELNLIQPKNINVISSAILIEKFPNYEKYLLNHQDILVITKGNNNSVTLLNLPESDKLFICTAAFTVIRVKNTLIDPAFLAWYLQHQQVQSELKSLQKTSTVPNLSIRELQNLDIPTISFEKQASIGELFKLESERIDILRCLSLKRKSLLDTELMELVNEKRGEQ